MLDVTHSQVDDETYFQVSLLGSITFSDITEFCKFINFSFNKMIFSIFKFLETAKYGLLLLSDILPCVVYC